MHQQPQQFFWETIGTRVALFTKKWCLSNGNEVDSAFLLRVVVCWLQSLIQLTGAHCSEFLRVLCLLCLEISDEPRRSTTTGSCLCSDLAVNLFFPSFLFFLCSLTRCLVPAPLKLLPYGSIQIYYYFILFFIAHQHKACRQLKLQPTTTI